MKEYVVRKLDRPLPLDGNVAKSEWGRAAPCEIATFPWYRRGKEQKTSFKALYSDRALYLLFECEDVHIYSECTELNGPVCEDSCVEFFASPQPERGPHYFNLEMNCCGVLLVGYGPGRNNRKDIDAALASRISIFHSVSGPTREESEDDDGWVIEAEIPFEVLAEFAGADTPKSGALWRFNAYRCGGKTDDQYAAVFPIDAPHPDFHRPEFFGPMRFE